jgi:thiol-disulfide isomerase/thioredoxin
MTNQNKITLFIAVVLIAGAIFWLDSQRAHVGSNTASSTPLALVGGTQAQTQVTTQASPYPSVVASPLSAGDIASIRAQKATQYKPAVEIVDPTGFINTPDGKPIKIADYIGKDVILVDFMTYSCINCQRTFPYTTAWYAKYKDQGFIIIGIHTPEFDFEKDYTNVSQAMKRFGITYPVVMDSNYGTWTAYGNQYWPREYLIDIDGYIREDHAGEDGYQDTEQNIKDLLKERDERFGITDTIDNSFVNPAGVVTSVQTNSPETYFGANRNQYFGNGTQGVAGVQTLTLPKSFSQNTFYFGGNWDIQGEYAQSQNAGDSFVYPYDAMNVYFVASASSTVVTQVTLDGKPVPTNMRGSDVYESGGNTYVKIQESRLYNIISGTAMESHTLQMTGQTPGLKAFTLTFG